MTAILQFDTCIIIMLPEPDKVIIISKLTGECASYNPKFVEDLIKSKLLKDQP